MAVASKFSVKVWPPAGVLVLREWMDLAIVLLPMLEFALSEVADAAPIARLLRLTRAVAPEQLARMGQMYRLRGLLTKGWRAVLVLRIVAKVTGNTPEKRTPALEQQIADAEAGLADLRAQAEALRRQVRPAEASEADLVFRSRHGAERSKRPTWSQVDGPCAPPRRRAAYSAPEASLRAQAPKGKRPLTPPVRGSDRLEKDIRSVDNRG